MSVDLGYTCRCCGQFHDTLPMSYGADAPVYWSEEFAADESSLLEADICIIKGEHYFVRGAIEIPVIDADTTFSWGVWVSLSSASFKKTLDLMSTEGRESEPPYFGWLSTELPVYGTSTVNLKTHVHTRPVGLRPTVELEPTGHPLAVEQCNGFTRERVREIAEQILHSGA
jgi:hypothetical protein